MLGTQAESEAFNVVSRLSDIRDILSGLQVVYDGVRPADRQGRRRRRRRRPARELDELGRSSPTSARRSRAAAVHARAGRHPRRGRAGARDGDRRSGLPGRRAAGVKIAAVALQSASVLAAPCSRSARPRRRRRPTLRRPGRRRRRPRGALGRRDAHSCSAAPEAAGAALGQRGAALDALLRGQPRLAGQRDVAPSRARCRGRRAATRRRSPRARPRWTARSASRRARRHVARPRRPATSTTARAWLLVREFRPPTRFSRAGADATLALDAARGRPTHAGRRRRDRPRRPARHLRGAAPLGARREPSTRPTPRLRRPARRGRVAPRLLRDRRAALRASAAPPRSTQARRRARALEAAARGGPRGGRGAAGDARSLEGFRAAPLPRTSSPAGPASSTASSRLVPIEYGRGVERRPRHARLRDPGGDHVPGRRRRSAFARPRADAARGATRRRRASSTRDLDAARRRARRGPRRPRRRPGRARRRDDGAALELIDDALPAGVEGRGRDRRLRRDRGLARPARGRGGGRRVRAAPSRRGSRPTASSSSARSSGCAGSRPALFQRIEGLFWYGDGGHAGPRPAREAPRTPRRGDRRARGGARRRARGRRARGRRRARIDQAPSSRTARSSSSARGSRRS